MKKSLLSSLGLVLLVPFFVACGKGASGGGAVADRSGFFKAKNLNSEIPLVAVLGDGNSLVSFEVVRATFKAGKNLTFRRAGSASLRSDRIAGTSEYIHGGGAAGAQFGMDAIYVFLPGNTIEAQVSKLEQAGEAKRAFTIAYDRAKREEFIKLTKEVVEPLARAINGGVKTTEAQEAFCEGIGGKPCALFFF